MKRLFVSGGAVALAAMALCAPSLSASGYVGIYGIVERVVVEPSEASPQRIQLWGAFAFVNGALADGRAVSVAKRGYLYFRMPALEDRVNDAFVQAARREWTDLKGVAGTGQAIGFGRWQYIGDFGRLQPDQRNAPGSGAWVIERAPVMTTSDLRVRPGTEAPALPSLYQTESGVVKLADAGSHASVVKMLKDALAAR